MTFCVLPLREILMCPFHKILMRYKKERNLTAEDINSMSHHVNKSFHFCGSFWTECFKLWIHFEDELKIFPIHYNRLSSIILIRESSCFLFKFLLKKLTYGTGNLLYRVINAEIIICSHPRNSQTNQQTDSGQLKTAAGI